MAKPWARYEQNYINHPKFLALNANAICLWLEGKNYCDLHQTDGFLPATALKTFRFMGTKSIQMLTRSAGEKLVGVPWAPLWDIVRAGDGTCPTHYHMHDYLDHNDCRDTVLERIQDSADVSAVRRLKNKDHMRESRARRKAILAGAAVDARGQSVDTPWTHTVDTQPVHSGHTVDTRGRQPSTPTETTTQTETPTSTEERERRASLSPPKSADPFLDQAITERAGRFVERYQELYPKHRFGALYALKPTRDYAAAVTLCQTWTDAARLERLAICFLTTDHKFAAEGSRTIPQFLALASWCDGELAAWEQRRQA